MARVEQEQVKTKAMAELKKFEAELNREVELKKTEMKVEAQKLIAAEDLELKKEMEANRHLFKMRELEMELDLEVAKMNAGSRDGQGNINVSD